MTKDLSKVSAKLGQWSRNTCIHPVPGQLQNFEIHSPDFMNCFVTVDETHHFIPEGKELLKQSMFLILPLLEERITTSAGKVMASGVWYANRLLLVGYHGRVLQSAGNIIFL